MVKALGSNVCIRASVISGRCGMGSDARNAAEHRADRVDPEPEEVGAKRSADDGDQKRWPFRAKAADRVDRRERAERDTNRRHRERAARLPERAQFVHDFTGVSNPA